MIVRLRAYQRGHSAATFAEAGAGPTRRAAISQSESPGRTRTVCDRGSAAGRCGVALRRAGGGACGRFGEVLGGGD
jgi:hypothetical protein